MRLVTMGVDWTSGAKRALALLVLGLWSVGCGGSYAMPEAGAKSASADDYFAGEEAAEEYSEGGADGGEMLRFSESEAMPAPSMSRQSAAPVAAKTVPADDSPSEGTADEAAPTDEPARTPEPQAKRRPMLIYRAELGLAVFRVRENLDTIEDMAVKLGGYLVERDVHRIQVRVPAAEFEQTVEKIIALGDVHRRHITAQDVTAEFTDLQIRLKNALAVRDRLEGLLKDAENVEEALKVEEQLSRVAEKIEVFKGRLKLLRELSAYSTITVEFSERTESIKSRVELPFPWLNEMGLGRLLDL